MRREHAAGGAAALALLLVYLLTLAPGLTLWDAGEFAAAAHTLGIPHPPGTPLYVAIARIAVAAVPWLETARTTNLVSAAATALALGGMAALFARWMGSALAGVGAAITAGAMSAVWGNATETEVYALALLASVLLLALADRAGRDDDERVTRLLAYGMALAPALHLSALVAGPAAIVLATQRADGSWRIPRALLLGGAMALAVALGTVSFGMLLLGLLLLGVAPLAAEREARAAPSDERAPRAEALRASHVLALALLAATAWLILLVRARHDPLINQGNPSTWSALLDVIARRQYAVAPLWPRQAPLWLQVGNLVQWADWQVALGLDDAVGGSWRRTPVSIVFALLATAGAAEHRRADPRSWRGTLVLLVVATLGVVVQLNLKAGPSYGFGILADGAAREARERDYFFALGFLAWGAWAGVGAVTLARRLGGARARPVGLAVAALPVLLNWRATDRSREPHARLASWYAEALLASAPRDAVLVAAGDNDTYPVWYAQAALGRRTDVTVVTVPLLGARWYRAELARRHALWRPDDVASWPGLAAALRLVAERAAASGRPLAVAVGTPDATRALLGAAWRHRGLVLVPDPARAARGERAGEVDREAAGAVARLLAPALRAGIGDTTGARLRDPAAVFVASLLACPAWVLGDTAGGGARLDSRCNYR